jgi:hypothetical protein
VQQIDRGKSFDASADGGPDTSVEPLQAAANSIDQPNEQSAILDAIGNQVGYLEGDSGEPYLRVYYYRVVSVLPEPAVGS